VVVEMIHDSRQQDGDGRLGNYLVLFDPEIGKAYSAYSQPARPNAKLSEEHYLLKITPLSDHGG
jgi:hypothetical protein